MLKAIRIAEKRNLIHSLNDADLICQRAQDKRAVNQSKNDKYIKAFSALIDGHADGLLAGANISKYELIKIMLSQKAIKLEKPIFSLAPVEIVNKSKSVYITDPVVRINPSPNTLAEMAIKSSDIVKSIEGKMPQIAIISYSDYAINRNRVENKVMKILLNKSTVNVYPLPVQLDVALEESIRKRKITGDYPDANLLIFPEITSANIFYKTLALFADGKVNTCGAILHGFEKCVLGIVSRSSKSEEIFRLITYMRKMVESLKKPWYE